MTFRYDPGSGLLKTASQYRATVLPHTIAHFEFWAFIILHFVFKAMFAMGLLPGADTPGSLFYVDWHNVKVITGMTTFFEVFYSNQSYNRYLHLYNLTRRLLGCMHDMCLFLRFTVKTKEPGYARLSFRYYTCSTVIFFHQVQTSDKEVSDEQWQVMVRQGLLKPEEQRYIAALPKRERTVRLLQWSAEVMGAACDKAKVPPTMTKDAYAHVLQVRTLQQEIDDVLSLPVPFQYFHILNIMVLANIALWCYKMSISLSCFAPIVFTLAQLIFLGMMELASQLSNPFGTDDVDFPSDDWVAEFIETSIGLMEDDSPGDSDEWVGITSVEQPLKVIGPPNTSSMPATATQGIVQRSMEVGPTPINRGGQGDYNYLPMNSTSHRTAMATPRDCADTNNSLATFLPCGTRDKSAEGSGLDSPHRPLLPAA